MKLKKKPKSFLLIHFEHAASTNKIHTFFGMGPGPMELGKLAEFRLKLGESISSLWCSFLVSAYV